ncbi:MAG TPA: phosphoribosylanthranilate isomerase [Xanthomonadales bacterium]
MNRVKVKICGLTRAEDVQVAIEAGADAIGFVFTASPRRINIDTAVRLSRYVPGGVLRVGLFLDQERSEIERVVNSVPLDLLQFHGNETEQECNLFGLPWLKAVAMEDAGSVKRAQRDYPGAAGLLLDSHSRGERGGSGKVFDWSLSASEAGVIWLAGGLNADNVGQAIRTVKPFAVDVSSGVEIRPGIKDAGMIKAFFKAVRAAETEL